MYCFRSLEGISMQELAQCLNLCFSDYEQPIRFTAESLQYYLTASGVDLSLSFGAFFNEVPIAAILNSSGSYNGLKVVFDAGTGVVPDHRGQKVFSQLFEYTCAQLMNRNIQKYYLEVLQSNKHAISIYSKKGFSICREYSVLTGSGSTDSLNSEIDIVPYPDFNAFPTDFSVEPSYEHTSYMVNQNPQLYDVLSLSDQAYCIYAKRNGEIIQMHYSALDALKDIMSALTLRYPSAMAKNVDFRYNDVIQMLKEIGFVEITRQYEMVRDI